MTSARSQRRFAGYRLLECIGVGGSAEVWSARARTGTERVAIKILHADLDAGGRALLEREVGAARVRHRNIVRMLDVVIDRGRVGLVMELCRGSLVDWQRAHGGLPPWWVAQVGIEALAGLAEAHRANLLHRDVKPGNLLVGFDDAIKLADFGVSSWLDDARVVTQTSTVWGTLPFVAPERRYGQAVDATSDLYGLAATLAYLGLGAAAGELFVPSVRERLAARMPKRLVAVLSRAGAYSPAERFPDAEAMASALREIVDELPGRGDLDFASLAAPVGLDTRTTAGLLPGAGHRRVARVISYATGALVAAGVGALVLPERLATGPSVHGPNSVFACEDAPGSTRHITRPGPRETMDAIAEDLDDDGKPELVFVNQLDESLSIYWGGGELLAPRVEMPIPRSGVRPAVGDVDGDGRTDLIVSSGDTGMLTLYRGRADREFAKPESIAQTPAADRIALVDWDGDGRLDLLMQLRIEQRCTAWRRGEAGARFAGYECIGPASDLLDPFGSSPVAVYRRTDDLRIVRHRPGPAMQMGPSEPVVDLAALRIGAPNQVIVRDNDRDGADEIYLPALAWPDRALLRIVPGGAACVVLSKLDLDDSLVVDVVDVDGDGLLDVVARATCSGCESNHELLLGVSS